MRRREARRVKRGEMWRLVEKMDEGGTDTGVAGGGGVASSGGEDVEEGS